MAYTFRDEINKLQSRIDKIKSIVENPENGVDMDDDIGTTATTFNPIVYMNKRDNLKYRTF